MMGHWPFVLLFAYIGGGGGGENTRATSSKQITQERDGITSIEPVRRDWQRG